MSVQRIEMCLEVTAEEHFRSECAEDSFELFNRTSRKIEGIQKDLTSSGINYHIVLLKSHRYLFIPTRQRTGK